MIAKYKLILVSVVILLVSIGSFYLYWYAKFANTGKRINQFPQQTIGGDETTSSSSFEPPVELSNDFDPSGNAGRYSVEKIDVESRQVKLSYLWPRERFGKSIQPIISCPAWDIKIFDLGKKTPRYVTLEKLMQIMSETPKAQMVLSGKCGDPSCYLMEKECELYINHSTQDAKQ